MIKLVIDKSTFINRVVIGAIRVTPRYNK